MMLDIAAKEIKEINLQPENQIEEIIQNVRTILTTRKGSVPLDRGFGINTDLLDLPVTIIRTRLTNEIIEAVEKFEPRVKVTNVVFNQNTENDGVVVPTVRIAIDDKVVIS